VYQSSLAEGLKQMAIAGQGIAWLPQICVQKSISQNELVQIGGQQMSLEIEIRIFRRAGAKDRDAEAFWKYLAENQSRARSLIDPVLKLR
jgi:DNA-binding transcriptional LysR family regulator